jgi:large subunit ribosomal protein L23
MAAKKTTTVKAVAKTDEKTTAQKMYERVIMKPRVTEKSTQVAEGNVYTFNIAPNATKIEVKDAIKAMYKVTPMKVNVVKIKQRRVVVRGKRGLQAGGRKAYVYLKKGDKIELI